MTPTPLITLYGAGPGFGLPEVSPYVTKTMVQLKMAGLAYRLETAHPGASPKGQLPFIDDRGRRIADSTFIRRHLEAAYGVDLDRGLTAAQRAQAWALERMIEDSLGWVSAWFRFMDDETFDKGPAHWFDDAPDEVRVRLKTELVETVAERLLAVGIGRHSPGEIEELGAHSLWALAAALGEKPFLMGEEPTSVDAIAFGMLAQILTPYFETPLKLRAERHANLVAYTGRMMRRFFPEHCWAAGQATAYLHVA